MGLAPQGLDPVDDGLRLFTAFAIGQHHVGAAKYVFSDLKTWGWFLLVVGAIQLVGVLGIWNRTTWGRWIGIASASANALLQLLFLPALPLLALALLALDVLVIYGLIAYGGRRRLV
jgi:uncharacterized membrane protein